jgi:ribonuclease HIII
MVAADEEIDMSKTTNYVCKISAAQAAQLRALLAARQWELDDASYAFWRARREKTTVVAYESGKLVVQGKGTADMVQFILEPEVLKEVRFGYEDEHLKVDSPEMFEPHAGIDESGKGDYFGPLVIAAAYVNAESAKALVAAGVQDSKAIKSDARMLALARSIHKRIDGKFAIVAIGPAAYNRMYAKIGNVNKLLAWGHARAIENLLEKQPDCPRAVSDQFGSKASVPQALMERGRKIKLEQRHRAESDIAVAAASILARATFVTRMGELSESAGVTLPKGASGKVRETAVALYRKVGEAQLGEYVKLHFRTTAQVKAEA